MGSTASLRVVETTSERQESRQHRGYDDNAHFSPPYTCLTLQLEIRLLDGGETEKSLLKVWLKMAGAPGRVPPHWLMFKRCT